MLKLIKAKNAKVSEKFVFDSSLVKHLLLFSPTTSITTLKTFSFFFFLIFYCVLVSIINLTYFSFLFYIPQIHPSKLGSLFLLLNVSDILPSFSVVKSLLFHLVVIYKYFSVFSIQLSASLFLFP